MSADHIPYELDAKPIGRGGLGQIYMGRHRSDGHEAAVKIAIPRPFAIARIGREIDIQSRLDHPNVMTVLIAGSNRHWYSMPRANGTLASRAPFRRSAWPVLTQALIDTCEGLSHAHAHEVVHRDLSPSNLLSVDGRWVIADWGLGQVLPSEDPRLTLDGQIFGTPAFTAPEVFVDPRRATNSADVYSLGRIAAWAVGVERSEYGRERDASKHIWQEFVDATTEINAKQRWPLLEATIYLREIAYRDLVVDSEMFDPCPNCHGDFGYDSGARCLQCHVPNPSYA